ncbi:MAG: peroxiredoxin-like family protein [Pseudomonadota bacterium]
MRLITAAGLLVGLFLTAAATSAERSLGKRPMVDQPPTVLDPVGIDDLNLGVGPQSIRPLLPGFNAPRVAVTGITGNQLAIDPQRRDRPFVITFFRGGWCPYCQTQFMELQKIEDSLASLGYDIFFVSPDRPELLSFGDPGPDAPYAVYSDPTLAAAKAYGVAYQVPESTLERHFRGGAFLREFSGEDHGLLPVPATFVVSADGEILFQYANPDHTKRVDGQLLLSAARTFVEESGP